MVAWDYDNWKLATPPEYDEPREPHVYFVRYEDCTDGEPRPGWYVSTEDEDRPFGPFDSREQAEAAGYAEELF